MRRPCAFVPNSGGNLTAARGQERTNHGWADLGMGRLRDEWMDDVGVQCYFQGVIMPLDLKKKKQPRNANDLSTVCSSFLNDARRAGVELSMWPSQFVNQHRSVGRLIFSPPCTLI